MFDALITLLIDVLTFINPRFTDVVISDSLVGLFLIMSLLCICFCNAPVFITHLEERFGLPSGVGQMIGFLVFVFVIVPFLGVLMPSILSYQGGIVSKHVVLLITGAVRFFDGVLVCCSFSRDVYDTSTNWVFMIVPYIMYTMAFFLIISELKNVITDPIPLTLTLIVLLLAFRGVSKFFYRIDGDIYPYSRLGMEMALYFLVFASFVVRIGDVTDMLKVLYYLAFPIGLLIGFIKLRW